MLPYSSSTDYLIIFFQANWHTKQKNFPDKLHGPIRPYSVASSWHMHSRGIQCKHTPYRAFWANQVKVVNAIRVCVRAWRVFPVLHVARGRKTLQTYGFPEQTYGRHSRGMSLILSRKSKSEIIIILVSCYSACPYKNYTPSVAQSSNNYLFSLIFSN